MRFPLTLETETAVPLYQQIYQQIRERILQGELGPGMRLPASRELARLYGLGRVTVTTAYEQLRTQDVARWRRRGLVQTGRTSIHGDF